MFFRQKRPLFTFVAPVLIPVLIANALGAHIAAEPDEWLRHTLPLREIEVGSLQNHPDPVANTMVSDSSSYAVFTVF